MKLWLLDADVIINLLSMGIFDSLSKNHQIYVATTVIDEVMHYYLDDEKITVNLRKKYIDENLIKEESATAEDLEDLFDNIPIKYQDAIDPGEIESLAIMQKESSFIFCTCDAAAIRMLPFIDASKRGVSVEELLKATGIKRKLLNRHTEKYFKNNLIIGKQYKIYNF